MTKVIFKEFVRTEILSVLSQIKPSDEIITTGNAYGELGHYLRIDDSVTFAMCADKKFKEDFSDFARLSGITGDINIKNLLTKNYLTSILEEIILNAMYQVLVQKYLEYKVFYASNMQKCQLNEKTIDFLKKYFSNPNCEFVKLPKN